MLHWSCRGLKFKAYYVLEPLEEFYEIKYTLDPEDYYVKNECFSKDHIYKIISENHIYKIISENNSIKITIEELLQNEDRIMLSGDLFKNRIRPYIRNQKINNIINGK